MPLIGILTIPDNDTASNTSTIDASYVKYLEGAGALSTPILFNATQEEIKEQFAFLNGVFFTGGPYRPTDMPRYFETATLLYSLVLQSAGEADEAGSSVPLWATCLGHQAVSDIAAGGVDILDEFDSEGLELSLELTEAASESKLFAAMPIQIRESLTTSNLTTNWHHYGVSPETFEATVAPAGLRLLSTNVGLQGKTFTSTMEHISAPITTVQWHPEANAYDYNPDDDVVVHDIESAATMSWLARYFVSQARTSVRGERPRTFRVEDYPVAKVGADYKYVLA